MLAAPQKTLIEKGMTLEVPSNGPKTNKNLLWGEVYGCACVGAYWHLVILTDLHSAAAAKYRYDEYEPPEEEEEEEEEAVPAPSRGKGKGKGQPPQTRCVAADVLLSTSGTRGRRTFETISTPPTHLHATAFFSYCFHSRDQARRVCK